MGNNVSVNMNCTFVDCNKITIGDNVLIASNVQLYTATHPVELAERYVANLETEQLIRCTYALPIKIGNGCWLGGGVIVLPGVTIGDGSVIGCLLYTSYKIIIEEQELIVIYPMKKRKISITKIEYIEISTSGSIKIIVQNEKKINLDAMLIGTESFIEYMKKNGVPIQENKGND